VQINALSWKHNGSGPPVPIRNSNGEEVGVGFVIGFTDEVQAKAVDAAHIFEVAILHNTLDDNDQGFLCRCAVKGDIVPVTPHVVGGIITDATLVSGPNATGVAFLVDSKKYPIHSLILKGTEVWVRLRGDFVLDTNNRAIDAEFVRAMPPTGDRPAGSPFGIEGGLFESWFNTRRRRQ
jgi:hypothetical protein